MGVQVTPSRCSPENWVSLIMTLFVGVCRSMSSSHEMRHAARYSPWLATAFGWATARATAAETRESAPRRESARPAPSSP